nr:protein brambleberry-like [Columba livia]
MLPRSCWVLLLFCAAARFFGCLGLSTPLENLGTPLELGVPPEVVVQLRSSCTHLSEEEEEELAKLGVDRSNCRAPKGHQTSPCTPDAHHGMEINHCGHILGCRGGKMSIYLEWPKLETPIHRSLQWLEETLVTSERLQVAQLMEDIIQEMGNASTRGATGLREQHRVVLSDLHRVQERARDVHSQLESDLDLLLTRQHQVEEVMEKLQQVNQSLGLMLVAMEGVQNRLENHLQHLHANLDPAGWSPSFTSCILHGSCFMLLVTLLVPTSPRVTLLLLFLTSRALSELLSIPALSALLVLAVTGQWLVTAMHRDAEEAWPAFPCHQLTSTPDRERELKLLQEELDRMDMSCLQEPSVLEQSPTMAQDVPSLGRVSPVPGGWRSKLSSYGVMRELAPGVKPYSPIQSLASDRSLLSPRSPCQGLTRVGQRCRKKAIPGQDFCHVHTTGRTLCSSLAMDSSPHI